MRLFGGFLGRDGNEWFKPQKTLTLPYLRAGPLADQAAAADGLGCAISRAGGRRGGTGKGWRARSERVRGPGNRRRDKIIIIIIILMRLYRALRGYSCGSRGFLEDRMMDIITGRAPPPARACFWVYETDSSEHGLGGRSDRTVVWRDGGAV